jgi:CheY-specific phosphatase CheX
MKAPVSPSGGHGRTLLATKLTASEAARWGGEVASAALELFDAFGIAMLHVGTSATLPEGEREEHRVAAVIGYGGTKVRGSIAMFGSTESVRRWHPELAPTAPLEAVVDKLGEFSNMLLGRFKYRMLLQGVALLLGTPTTASGKGLRVRSPEAWESRWLTFAGASGRVDIRVDVQFNDGFVYGSDRLAKAPAAAGETILF